MLPVASGVHISHVDITTVGRQPSQVLIEFPLQEIGCNNLLSHLFSWLTMNASAVRQFWYCSTRLLCACQAVSWLNESKY